VIKKVFTNILYPSTELYQKKNSVSLEALINTIKKEYLNLFPSYARKKK